MPFDTMAMAAVADELAATLTGGRIQRVIQPSGNSIALAIYARGMQRWLVLSADPRFARVNLSSDRLAKAFATPSPFVMLLRKHLDGARLDDIAQVRGERVLVMRCVAGDASVEVVAEAMGKHSNVILVGNGKILGALKAIPPHQSRVRPVLPGLPFSLPPAQPRDEKIFSSGPRIDPHENPASFREAMGNLPPETPLRAALLGIVIGAGPFLAGNIALAAGADPTSTFAETDIAALCAAAADFYSLYSTRAWRPHTFANARDQRDFAPYPPLGLPDSMPAASMSAAIEECVGVNESRDSLLSTRTVLRSAIERARRSSERRLGSLREGLTSAAGAEAVMEQGQLILAYQYLIPPEASEVVIPDLDLAIPLDPALTPSMNAERVFKRYHKLRDAGRRVPALIADTERELARLDDLRAFAELATTETDLRALANEILPASEQENPIRKQRDKPRGPARFVLGGHKALVGRNALENEEVTFRLARRNDLWLHVRERTGAHVILQGGDRGAPDEIIQAAAELAAYYSEGRSDSGVDVDIARPQDVRKIPGGPPGRVTYRNFRTVRVRPSLGTWEPTSAKP